MTTFFTIFFSFVLTGLVGNAVVARYQYRNWIAQQKVGLAQQRNLQQIALHEELERLASARRFHALRFAYALMGDDQELMEDRLRELDKTVVQWNERYTSFLARLRIYRPFRVAIHVEDFIHTPLASCTTELLALRSEPTEIRRTKIKEKKFEKRLNDVNGSIIAFSRDYLTELDRQASVVIDPDTNKFTRESIEYFSTLFLFKALFKPRNREFS